jgi:uncharacterized protein YodC (DUF2158 family)
MFLLGGRMTLPIFVTEFLDEANRSLSLKRACPDLAIWDVASSRFRFVKCRLWDRPSNEQNEFLEYVVSRGVSAEIIEWIFDDYLGAVKQPSPK